MGFADVLALQTEIMGFGFSAPSAAVFAGLVRFGFSVEELSAMEFEEIAYWMAAVTEYGEAVRAVAEKAAEGRKH